MDKVIARISENRLPRRVLVRLYVQRWWVPENVRVRTGHVSKRSNYYITNSPPPLTYLSPTYSEFRHTNVYPPPPSPSI